ncbi:TPA: hypothetical protein DEQ22_00520 [Candidatus Nomurabacteria bacterium]|uniref:M23ase beta-sheet core domain-containing protein n=2 Tax=Candidatus Nomuraibacteriota TaxID=1752729 RepID=A0A1F6YM01_9BACT|nr:MAG: Peptidase, M23 family [Parcubacteria group bacterium GW2011_GWC1_42_21]KKS58712.1 MAG: Peptidase, M23 family [Candidatus Nomurabacteria bacterium GW2011_GWF1_42_40]KKT00729.1 MAG: Peptidase, M23 family [Candidatus Nomurabacteria bacterium GW2011_GWA1_43_17]KKT07927.1 MAG: Peptidase, M23 family [Candidatus Nomurabacteria bacterium GW2011_GWB1_43_19]KKT11888.1 MAG: Peptidase, M23 family [Candidatus Nomurabacteria bacterium GW2011_GWF2_43_24]KKT18358.1 MAG: Peptidase, M23 family [Candidat
MKPYPDYKKLFNIVVLLAVLLAVPVVFSHAQTATEIRNKISEKDSDIRKLEQEIAAYQTQLNGLEQQKSSLSKSLKELDITKKKLNADISITQNKIDKTNLKIQSLSSDINSKENSIGNNIDSIKLGIKNINEFEQAGIVETILSDNDFSVIWNDIDSMIAVRERIRADIVELKQMKGALEDTRKVTIDAKNELTKLKSQLSDQQKIVVQNTNEKNKLLTQTKNNEANYQKLLKDRIAQRDAFEKELQDYEAQLQLILDPSQIPKGRLLSWPLDSIYVTSPYAPRWGGFHRGTDFRAAVGTPVKAMAEGTVRGIGDTDICCPGASFGKWIFIEYNNGLSSAYGHLSLISVREGQKVGRGEVVGYSGNTGSSTGPHLHVSLYVSSGVQVDSFESRAYPGKTLVQPRVSAINAHLDPMLYLPLYSLR